MHQKIIAAMLCAWIALAIPYRVEAGGGGFAGATEVTQLLNHGELISILGEDIAQTAQQLQMLQNLYANTTGIPIQAWGSVANHLEQLVNTVSSAMGPPTPPAMP